MGEVQSQQSGPALTQHQPSGQMHRLPSGAQAGVYPQPQLKVEPSGVPAVANWWQAGSGREQQLSQLQRPRQEGRPRAPPPQQQPNTGAGLVAQTHSRMSICLEDVEIDKSVKPLGKGTFGIVYKARLKGNHQTVAVKEIDKTKLQQLKVSKDDVRREVEIMREGSSANCHMSERLVQIIDMLETKNRFYIILELCDNGNLQDAAMCREAGFGEEHVRLLMKQMLEAIIILHSKDICHRDIKPHNYLVCGNIDSRSVKIKLGDFGLAVRLPKGKLLRDQAGTPAFMAPEMHLLPNKSSGYDHKVDVWAIGVCMVFLLASEYPFIDGSGRLLRHRIIQGDVPLWEENAFQNLFNGFQEAVGIRRKRPSVIAVNLTRRLLAPRRQDRPNAVTAMKHDWFHRPIISEDAGAGDNLSLLDRRDFQAGFQAAMDVQADVQAGFQAFGKEIQAAMDVIGKVEIGGNDHTPYFNTADARSRSCAVCRGPTGSWDNVCPQCRHARTTSWSTAASFGDVAQHRSRTVSLSSEEAFGFNTPYLADQRRARTMSGDSLAEVNGFMAPPSSAGGRPRTRSNSLSDPPYQNASHEAATNHANRSACCLLCKTPSSMLDHVCPICSSSVCAGCIRRHLEKDPRCPHCHDRDNNAQHMQMMLNAHSFWHKVKGIVYNF